MRSQYTTFRRFQLIETVITEFGASSIAVKSLKQPTSLRKVVKFTVHGKPRP